MERSPTKRRWEGGWSDLVRLGLLMRRMALDWNLSRRKRVDLEHHPRRGSITLKKDGFGTCIDRRWEDEKNPRALARKSSFWDACLAREWMWVFQVRLDERERPSCVKEAEVSSSWLFMRTAGKFWLRLREITACFVLLWLNETRLSLPHFSITVRSLERNEAEMLLCSWISVEAWSFGLNENEELMRVSSAKEWMLEDVEVSRSFMNRMKSTGEMTEPWGTPALMECRLERKPSTLWAIDISERKLPIQLMSVMETKHR